jgi:hypothetical protein
VRSLARRHGYIVRKSRKWKYIPSVDDLGNFTLVDNHTNGAVLGFRYSATLDEIEAWLTS